VRIRKLRSLSKKDNYSRTSCFLCCIAIVIVIVAAVLLMLFFIQFHVLSVINDGKNVTVMTQAKLIAGGWSETVFVHRDTIVGYAKSVKQVGRPLSTLARGRHIFMKSRMQGSECIVLVNGERVAMYALSLGSYCTDVNISGTVQLVQRITDRVTARFSNITIVDIVTGNNSHYVLRIETLKLPTIFITQIPLLAEGLILLILSILAFAKGKLRKFRLGRFRLVTTALILGLSMGLIIEGLSLISSDYIAIMTSSIVLYVTELVLTFILIFILLIIFLDVIFSACISYLLRPRAHSNHSILCVMLLGALGIVSVYILRTFFGSFFLFWVVPPWLWQLSILRFCHGSSLLHAVGLVILQLIPIALTLLFSRVRNTLNSSNSLDMVSDSWLKHPMMISSIVSFLTYSTGFTLFFALHDVIRPLLMVYIFSGIAILAVSLVIHKTLGSGNVAVFVEVTSIMAIAWLILLLNDLCRSPSVFRHFYSSALVFTLSPIALIIVVNLCIYVVNSCIKTQQTTD